MEFDVDLDRIRERALVKRDCAVDYGYGVGAEIRIKGWNDGESIGRLGRCESHDESGEKNR